MAEKSNGAENFEISRIFSRTFQAIGSNPALYLAVTLVLGAGPGFAMRWLQYQQGGAGNYMFVLANPDTGGLPFLLLLVLNLFAAALLQAALTRATLLSLGGEKPGFDRSLEPAIAMTLPLVGMNILSGIGVALALLLLIVPGILLWLAWAVAVPVYVEERRGVTESLTRSAELTKGARGKIFVAMLVVFAALLALGIGAGVVNRLLVTTAQQSWLPALITTVITALGTMTTVTLHASIYAELREVKEGGGTDKLETIFA